jgi:hypothetical protein
MLELRIPKGATLAAQLDELVLLDGEDELRALTQRLQDAIFRARVPIRQIGGKRERGGSQVAPLLRFSA